MSSKKRLALSLTATVLWLCVIYTLSSRPADVSHSESAYVLDILRQVEPSVTMRFVRKLAHFIEYFILGGLLYLDWRFWGRGRLWLPFAAGLAVAGSDELLQSFVPGRSAQLSDVLLDGSGVLCALLAALLLERLLHRRKERRQRGTGTEQA